MVKLFCLSPLKLSLYFGDLNPERKLRPQLVRRVRSTMFNCVLSGTIRFPFTTVKSVPDLFEMN